MRHELRPMGERLRELDELRADKARLDWLETKASQSFATEEGDEVEYVSICEALRGSTLREGIDAAMNLPPAPMTPHTPTKPGQWPIQRG